MREKERDPSRIGDQNRRVVEGNSERAKAWRELANEITALPSPRDLKPEAEQTRKTLPPAPLPRRPLTPVFQLHAHKHEPRDRFERQWAQRDHERRVSLERRELYEGIELGRKHQTRKLRLDADLEARNGPMKATMSAEMDAIDRRLQAKGVTRFFRTVFGWTMQDRQEKALYEKTLARLAEREKEERDALARQMDREKRALAERYGKLRGRLEDHIALRHATRREQLNLEPRREAPIVPDREGPPKKPAPKLELRPPGVPKPHFRQEVYDRQAKDWAASKDGQKALAKDPAPREDWAASHKPKHDPADVRTAEQRARDASARLRDAQARTFSPDIADALFRERARDIDKLAGKERPKDHFSQAAKEKHAPPVREDWAKASSGPAPSARGDWAKSAPEPARDKGPGRDRQGRD